MVDYNKFGKTFSKSREKIKWEEIDYFISKINKKNKISILDIGCGNGRLLGELLEKNLNFSEYIGIDLSSVLLIEAKKKYSNYDFIELDMLDLNKIDKKFDVVFFIASFHHLEDIGDRIEVLNKLSNLIKKGSLIFMTNWALNSKINNIKYEKSIINGSENEFGGIDYNIKIGEFLRFYHCFSLEELDFLFKNAGFKILENKLFKNGKNFISILEKK